MEKTKTELTYCIVLATLLLCAGSLYYGVLASEQSAPIVTTTKPEWKPAIFRTLVLGKSKQSDMLRLLGPPDWSGRPMGEPENDPNPEVWNDYNSGGEFPGKLSVIYRQRSRVVVSIYLYPDNLIKPDVISHFGNDYVETSYDYDTCLGNEESAPLYESPGGQIRFIEYRSRGIAVKLDDDGNRVKDISYLSGPIGAKTSKCKH